MHLLTSFKSFLTTACICTFIISLGVAKVQAQGSIAGTVYEEGNKEPLAGANIVIKGTSRGTTTDSNGRFELDNIPKGNQVLVVSFIGYRSREIGVNISDVIEINEYDIDIDVDETAEIEVYLETEDTQLEAIAVTSYRRGQQRALNKQKEAANIKNIIDAELIATFPDPNVGESLKRIPGINIQSDQGEARYIQIRGTSPSLSNVSINGEQVATPEGSDRQVAMDMIPSDVLSSIEVTKAITPDMDGDAIGGSVNLETKSALTDERVFGVTLNGGYHNNVSDLSPVGGRASVNFGQRVGDESQFGYMIGVNYNKNSIGSDNNEMEYDEGELDEIQLRDYELTRERFGVSSNFDYRFSRESRLFFNTSYNYFADLEFRRRLTLEADEVARELKDRLEKQKIFSASLGGEHGIGDSFAIDYRISYSYSDQNTSKDREIGYVQAFEDQNGDDIDFISFDRSDPDYPQFLLTPQAPAAAGAYNYDSFEFDEFADASELTTDQHITSRLNLSKDYTLSDNVNGILKLGGSTRFKSKDRVQPENIYGGYNGSSTYPDLLSNFEDDDFLFGKDRKSVV